MVKRGGSIEKQKQNKTKQKAEHKTLSIGKSKMRKSTQLSGRAGT